MDKRCNREQKIETVLLCNDAKEVFLYKENQNLIEINRGSIKNYIFILI